MQAGEYITPGPPRALFNNICGGCHGSLSGSELDIAVSADALTGASVSQSRYADPQQLTVELPPPHSALESARPSPAVDKLLPKDRRPENRPKHASAIVERRAGRRSLRLQVLLPAG